MNKNSLKQDEIKHLLKLEELFYNRFLNVELLNQLVSLYVKAIDICNDKLSIVKIYFLQKMQFVLSRPEVEKLLNQKQGDECAKDRYSQNISSLEIKFQARKYVQKSSLDSQPVDKKLAYISDEEQRIKSRSNRIRIQMQMFRETESINQKQLQKWEKEKEKSLSITKPSVDLEYQKDNLREKSAKRILQNKSDCLKGKDELNQLQQQNTISNNCLINVHQQLNSKFPNSKLESNLENKTNQFKLFNKPKSVDFSKIHNDVFEDDVQIPELELQIEGKKKMDVFYSLSYATFAPGHNTPDLTEKESTIPTSLPSELIPSSQDLPDPTQLIQQHHDSNIYDRNSRTSNSIYEDYANDEYF